MPQCLRCKKDLWLPGPQGMCVDCEAQSRKDSARTALGAIVVTTGGDIPGRTVAAIIDVVGADAAIAASVFKDIANNIRDFIGGRSETVQRTLREAREQCLSDLRKAALEIGADAVIALKMDFSEASTTSGGILFVTAIGTAVKLEPPVG